MSTQTKTMTEGNPYVLIFSFALPLMAGNVFQQLYTVVDTMIVGRALGVEALAALGSADWFNWMLLSTVQGLAQGFAVMMAQHFGAGKIDDLKQTVGNSIILACISSVVLLITSQIIARPVLLLLNTPENIIGNALLYLRIMFAGLPIVMAYNLLASILRALGNSKTPLYAMIIASVTNIILDLLFVIVLHFGIAGAGIATLIAQFISCIYCLLHMRKISVLAMSKCHFKLQLPLVSRLMYLGTPMALQNILISIGGMIVQSVVNGFGVTFIAGYTATNKLYGVLEIAAFSYGYAMTTYIGQNLGAENIKRIYKGTKAAVIIAILTSFVIGTIMIIFGRQIVGLFISGTPDQTMQAIDIGYLFLKILSIFLPVLYIVHVFRNAVSGLGNSMFPMLSGVMEFVVRSGACFILPMFLGETGIFYGEVLAWTGANIALITGYVLTMKKIKSANASGPKKPQ